MTKRTLTPKQQQIQALIQSGASNHEICVRAGIKASSVSYYRKILDMTRELSESEQEVLRLLANGLSYDGIASELGLTTGTVKHYVYTAYTLKGIKRRTELMQPRKEFDDGRTNSVE